jgi:hypothetical protein
VTYVAYGRVLTYAPKGRFMSTEPASAGKPVLQAYAAYSLLQQPPHRVGFASGCQAFGHRELLGVLRSFGLVMEPNLTVQH